MTTKTAKVQIAAVWLTCPHCDEALTNRDGRPAFTVEDFADSVIANHNTRIKCPACGEIIRLPTHIFA